MPWQQRHWHQLISQGHKSNQLHFEIRMGGEEKEVEEEACFYSVSGEHRGTLKTKQSGTEADM